MGGLFFIKAKRIKIDNYSLYFAEVDTYFCKTEFDGYL